MKKGYPYCSVEYTSLKEVRNPMDNTGIAFRAIVRPISHLGLHAFCVCRNKSSYLAHQMVRQNERRADGTFCSRLYIGESLFANVTLKASPKIRERILLHRGTFARKPVCWLSSNAKNAQRMLTKNVSLTNVRCDAFRSEQ